MNEKIIKIKAAALSCFLDYTVLFYEKNNETIIAPTKNYIAPLLDNYNDSAIFLGEGSGYAFNLLSASYEFDDMPTNLSKKLKEEYDKLFPVLEKHKEKLPLIIKPPYKGFPSEQFYDGEYYNDLLTHRVVCENKKHKDNLMKSDAVDIISNSYKTVIYDEIEDIFSDADSVLSEDQAKFLCERNNILDFIYEEWITNSIISSTREDLITTILGLRRNMTEYEVKSN